MVRCSAVEAVWKRAQYLGDTLDVVTQDLAVTLGTAFTETFAAFTTTGHCVA